MLYISQKFILKRNNCYSIFKNSPIKVSSLFLITCETENCNTISSEKIDRHWLPHHRTACLAKKNLDSGGSLHICSAPIPASISRAGFKPSKTYLGNSARSSVNPPETAPLLSDSRERKTPGMKSRCLNFPDCLSNYRKKKKR